MILYLLKENTDYSTLKEKLEASSASYKFIDLYGKKLVLGWPDSCLLNLQDQSIESIVNLKSPYILSGNNWKQEPTVVNVSGVEIGGEKIVVAAGPCSVESEEQVESVAKVIKSAGAKLLRGGTFKPRTSPYSFQGLGLEGIKILKKVGDSLSLPIVSEILDVRSLDLYKDIDMIQVGTRNSQNFPLLRELGKFGKPVLLKRGMSITVEEWLASADYVLYEGNGNVVLCERGVRTFEKVTRFTLDIGGIAAVKLLSHLPVCADPSHSAGKRELVQSHALAAIAAGADMLLVEVHPNPEKALSDSEQQLTLSSFALLMERIKALASVLGRKV
ncbi:MAG: 3-deoxy-7-phosphoheptulonate synthase [Candidatus Brockarchaeota archaeon]|nr:3-deoxy-7-phosphoheptulonate synthase [Candidatus Brockarchaeota archaeon]MBO3767852.1 3-deoxy-7-phosphoheptulonate synthase [Candidatus Brockarchaeota archaeon]